MLPIQANERIEFFSGAVTVAFGVNEFKQPVRIGTHLAAGLKIVVLLSGRLRIRVGADAERDIAGPSLLVLRAREDTPRASTFAADIPVRYALVQIDLTRLDPGLSEALDARALRDDEEEPVLYTRPADRTLQSLALQVLNCPIRSAERDLFVCGKALQLAALAVGQCLAGGDAEPVTRKIPHAEVAQLRAAREALLAALDNPPGVQQLAAASGMNVGKFNAGFRRLFGATPYKYLQECRLAEAYRLIASGETSVSQAAYRVGYNPAHFATVFRKRFGVSPSDLL